MFSFVLLRCSCQSRLWLFVLMLPYHRYSLTPIPTPLYLPCSSSLFFRFDGFVVIPIPSVRHLMPVALFIISFVSPPGFGPPPFGKSSRPNVLYSTAILYHLFYTIAFISSPSHRPGWHALRPHPWHIMCCPTDISDGSYRSPFGEVPASLWIYLFASIFKLTWVEQPCSNICFNPATERYVYYLMNWHSDKGKGECISWSGSVLDHRGRSMVIAKHRERARGEPALTK